MKHLLATCLLLLTSCGILNSPENRDQWAINFLNSIGDAAIRVEGVTALRKYAPEAIAIFDTNNDSMITLEEVQVVIAAATNNPEYMTFVILMAYEAYKNRHHRNDA